MDATAQRFRRRARRESSLLLERENQRLIAKNLQLTAELARLRGQPDVEQLTFTVEQTLQQTRAPRSRGVPTRRQNIPQSVLS